MFIFFTIRYQMLYFLNFLALLDLGFAFNAIIIIGDDAGFESELYDHPYCKMPHLQYIMQDGGVYMKAYTSSPSCSSSRATFYTALPQHQNGMYGLHNGVHNFNCLDVTSISNDLAQNTKIFTGLIGTKHVGTDESFRFHFESTDNTYPSMQIGRNTTFMKHELWKFRNAFEDYKKKNGISEVNGSFLLIVSFQDPHRCHQNLMPIYGPYCERFGDGKPISVPISNLNIESILKSVYGKNKLLLGVDRNETHFTISGNSNSIPDWTPLEYDANKIKSVEPYYPDTSTTRMELAAQYKTISRLDSGIGMVVREMKHLMRYSLSSVMYMSDNGVAFPRGRTNLYDLGVRIPFVLSMFYPINPNHLDNFTKTVLYKNLTNKNVNFNDELVISNSLESLANPQPSPTHSDHQKENVAVALFPNGQDILDSIGNLTAYKNVRRPQRVTFYSSLSDSLYYSIRMFFLMTGPFDGTWTADLARNIDITYPYQLNPLNLYHKAQSLNITPAVMFPDLPLANRRHRFYHLLANNIFGSASLHEITGYYPMRSIIEMASEMKVIHNLNHLTPFPIDSNLYVSPTYQDMLNRTLAGRSLEWNNLTLRQYYFRPEWEFYDLVQDPLELNNLYHPKFEAKPEAFELSDKDANLNRTFHRLKHKLQLWQNFTYDPWLCLPRGQLVKDSNQDYPFSHCGKLIYF